MRKKVIVGIMSVLLIMMLSACSEDNKVKTEGSSKNVSEVEDQSNGVSLSMDSHNTNDEQNDSTKVENNSTKMDDLIGEHADIKDSLNKDMQDDIDDTTVYTTVGGHGDQATGTLKELLNK